MAAPSIIILARHGETDANGQPNTLRGWTDYQLDDHGHKQADRTAEFIAENWPQTKKIYCSTLDRARQSASYLERELKLKRAETLALRPWNPGELAGRFVPNLDKVMLHYSNNLDEAPEHGESMRTFIHRFIDFLSSVMDEVENGQGPIVCYCSVRNVEAAIGWIEEGAKAYRIDPKRLVAKEESVPPGGVLVLSQQNHSNWDYEIEEVPDSDDNGDSKSRPEKRNTFGMYQPIARTGRLR